MREHRLYQADWLLRFYGFGVEEVVPESAPDLSLDVDPKTAWALRNPAVFPIDVNKAPREQLLRIPGVGARSVEQMLRIRRWQRLRLQDLILLKVALKRARPFIIASDYKPPALLQNASKLLDYFRPPAQQLSLAL